MIDELSIAEAHVAAEAAKNVEPKEVKIEVSRFLCPICGAQRVSKTEALECCACEKCGIPRKLDPFSTRGSRLCGTCAVNREVSNARAEVKRREEGVETAKYWAKKNNDNAEKNLEDSKKRLEVMLAKRDEVRKSKKRNG